MTTLRQFRSSGPMRAPCSRGLSLGHFMLNVYSVLFLCIPGTLLMANYNMLSTAKTTITAVSSNLYSTSGIGVTLLLLGFCFAYVRKDNKMSKVGGETSDADKEKGEGSSAASVSAHLALKLLRPLNYYQFSQALQLFMLYGVQLAIFPRTRNRNREEEG